MAEPIHWLEPGRLIQDMLLAEPGSRIEGPTPDVLQVVFVAAAVMLGESMRENDADALALRLLPRIHAALADHGYVVREYAADR